MACCSDLVNQIRKYKIICTLENEPLRRYEELRAKHYLTFKRSSKTKSAALNIVTGEWVLKASEARCFKARASRVKSALLSGSIRVSLKRGSGSFSIRPSLETGQRGTFSSWSSSR